MGRRGQYGGELEEEACPTLDKGRRGRPGEKFNRERGYTMRKIPLDGGSNFNGGGPLPLPLFMRGGGDPLLFLKSRLFFQGSGIFGGEKGRGDNLSKIAEEKNFIGRILLVIGPQLKRR